MGRTRDPRRPTTINDDDLRQANESTEVRDLITSRTKAKDTCEDKFEWFFAGFTRRLNEGDYEMRGTREWWTPDN
jgi:hypothetical protein